jgi:hypothetical protein
MLLFIILHKKLNIAHSSNIYYHTSFQALHQIALMPLPPIKFLRPPSFLLILKVKGKVVPVLKEVPRHEDVPVLN